MPEQQRRDFEEAVAELWESCNLIHQLLGKNKSIPAALPTNDKPDRSENYVRLLSPPAYAIGARLHYTAKQGHDGLYAHRSGRAP